MVKTTAEIPRLLVFLEKDLKSYISTKKVYIIHFGKSLESYSRDYITVSTRSEMLPQTNKVKLMCKKCEAPFELLVKGYFLYLVQGSQIVL